MPHSAPGKPEFFVQWFRAAAPYIHAFRGRIFVIAFGGEIVSDGQFIELIPTDGFGPVLEAAA